MIRGTVNYNNEAVVPLRVRGPSGSEVEIDAVIDTGFTGFLTLPPALTSALGLQLVTNTATRLGDGTMRYLDVYEVEIEWDAAWVAVRASEIDAQPLIGTRLLAGHEVFIEFVPGGGVDITPLP